MSNPAAQPETIVVDAHAQRLRDLCARMQAIGTPAAATILDVVGGTLEAHLDAVDAAFEFVAAAEAAITAH